MGCSAYKGSRSYRSSCMAILKYKQQPKSDLLIDYDIRIASCGDWLTHGRIESTFETKFMMAQEIKKIIID